MAKKISTCEFLIYTDEESSREESIPVEQIKRIKVAPNGRTYIWTKDNDYIFTVETSEELNKILGNERT